MSLRRIPHSDIRSIQMKRSDLSPRQAIHQKCDWGTTVKKAIIIRFEAVKSRLPIVSNETIRCHYADFRIVTSDCFALRVAFALIPVGCLLLLIVSTRPASKDRPSKKAIIRSFQMKRSDLRTPRLNQPGRSDDAHTQK